MRLHTLAALPDECCCAPFHRGRLVTLKFFLVKAQPHCSLRLGEEYQDLVVSAPRRLYRGTMIPGELFTDPWTQLLTFEALDVRRIAGEPAPESPLERLPLLMETMSAVKSFHELPPLTIACKRFFFSRKEDQDSLVLPLRGPSVGRWCVFSPSVLLNLRVEVTPRETMVPADVAKHEDLHSLEYLSAEGTPVSTLCPLMSIDTASSITHTGTYSFALSWTPHPSLSCKGLSSDPPHSSAALIALLSTGKTPTH